MADEPGPVVTARKALAEFLPAFEQLTTQVIAYSSSDKELAGRVSDLTRRLKETEERARTAEARADELKDKADRSERLDETTRKLVEALDKLPVTMEESHLIPGSVKPAIPLYGTYEWRGVVDAKFWLKEAMKEKRVM